MKKTNRLCRKTHIQKICGRIATSEKAALMQRETEYDMQKNMRCYRGKMKGEVEMRKSNSMKKSVAVSMAVAMMLSASGSFVQASEAKWSETEMPDGWIMVTNEGGKTLGYSPESGVTLIEQDGYAFKDLDKDGELDVYEDWREDANTRAADLASQMSADDILPTMVHETLGAVSNDMETDPAKEFLDEGKRSMLVFESCSATEQAAWNNMVQAYVEGIGFGIPVNSSTNERQGESSAEFYAFPSNLGMAATFDTELANRLGQEFSKEYRAIGVSTLLGPQIDLLSEPRWSRIATSLGEDPALSRDMANALISGYQSTYAEDGTDLGWGEESMVGMMKHFPGDGAGESGREAHTDSGKYNVYPGNGFAAHLVNFFDGGLHLDSATGETAAVMPSYSIAYTEDGSLGELVGSAFSEYKIGLLRNNGYDGLICSDWGVTKNPDEWGCTSYGNEDKTKAEKIYLVLKAGVDQIGAESSIDGMKEGYALLVDDIGEETALAQIRESSRRINRTLFQIGLFDNPYVDTAKTAEVVKSEEALALGKEASLKSIVMVKNENEAIRAAEGEEKPTAYIPMQFADGEWKLPVDLKTANEYYNIVTDTVGDPTGEADEEGNATYTAEDIVRASAEELTECSVALVMVQNPQNVGKGYVEDTDTYIPISLQYGEYTATCDAVRATSIAGNVEEVAVENPYVTQTQKAQENRSYYGETAMISNTSDLDGILYTVENMPEDAKIIVAVNADKPMVFSEFESQVDAILVGFDIVNDNFLEIASGKYEPSGLLPMQMPASMEAVEAQLEDVPRDMECYVDAAGNTYDFAYGLNWSGVISDERTEKYAVEPLTAPESITLE